ncbi:CBS domain-containing protein [Aestuariibacter salexigens]|uniref:CBS domain-containing protein n=1 Tax=Aestuariibacter salexigens TaxID=226010 RepID=UPI00040A5FBB
MSKRVVTVPMDCTLASIKDIFEHTRFHHLLVTSEKKLMGVVSDRDLLKHLSPFIDTPVERQRDLSTLQKRAHQVMTRDVISLPPNAGIIDAIKLFNRHTLSCLPIVDVHNHPVGIVTWRDILQYAEQMVEERKAPD